jgi:hypothetical protein
VIELELGNKADLLEIGRVKKVESGKKARQKQLGVLSQNDITQEPEEPKPAPPAPVSTRAEIAKAAGVSTGQQTHKASFHRWRLAAMLTG